MSNFGAVIGPGGKTIRESSEFWTMSAPMGLCRRAALEALMKSVDGNAFLQLSKTTKSAATALRWLDRAGLGSCSRHAVR